jgi:shikimate dehydrogenase
MPENRKAACVIGWPVEHSRSPMIHNHWIGELGLDAEYRREAVPPDRLAEFVSGLAGRGYVGANVTVPHKQAALELAAPDDRAEAVGAANTLWLDGGTLRATNTDVEGFIGNLDATVPGWDRGLETAVVLGAGGAARAVIFGLLKRSIGRINVINRNFERAMTLRGEFGGQLHPLRWEEKNELLAGSGLLVNATSLGMAGQPRLDISLNRLPLSAIIADIVYAPLETELLKDARERGLRTVDGLGMLLHQAVGGFERWFGVRPPVTQALRALIEADLMSDSRRANIATAPE